MGMHTAKIVKAKRPFRTTVLLVVRGSAGAAVRCRHLKECGSFGRLPDPVLSVKSCLRPGKVIIRSWSVKRC